MICWTSSHSKKAPSCELGLKILDPIVCHSFFHRIPHENNNMSWTVNPCNSSILRPSVFHSHLLIAILILLMPLYIQISWLGEYLNFHPLFEYIGLSPWKKIPWFSMACIPPNIPSTVASCGRKPCRTASAVQWEAWREKIWSSHIHNILVYWLVVWNIFYFP